MRARRYQLRKEALGVVGRGHPWIFRDQLSSAATVFADGEWMRLVDGTNKTVAYGFYEAEGAIAIRVLRRGPDKPDAAWLRGKLTAALGRRGLGSLKTAAALLQMSPGAQAAMARGETDGAVAPEPAPALSTRTDAMRLVHGESDGIPGVVVDRFGDTLVVQSYARGADALARFAATAIARELRVPHVVLRPAHRRRARTALGIEPSKVLRGTPPALATFTEDGLAFTADLAGGQKSGTYLDLRGLRHAIATLPLAGKRVLNLFAYSGMLGRAAEAAGAASITQVDVSEKALAFAAAHHVTDAAKHTLVTGDVFDWLPALDAGELYDLVIVDPPSMTSNVQQVPAVLAGYKKLYRAAAPHVKPGGLLVSACCTSRVERAVFEKTVREVLPPSFARERSIPPEIDHPVGFAQADYLKILLWRRAP